MGFVQVVNDKISPLDYWEYAPFLLRDFCRLWYLVPCNFMATQNM